ncbi:MAG TPA: alpha/beta hydrolase [Candidatus Aquilonibacter sp.]|nr:alpha/beta hydrolase [Candidatus Aquilonibacter sp.]
MRSGLALVVCASLLSACSSASVAPSFIAPYHASAPIGAAPGGTLSLLHGDSVTVAPHLLAADQSVSLDYSGSSTDTPPNAAWSVAPGVLTISMPQGTGVAANAAQASYDYAHPPVGLHVVMAYEADNAAAIESAKAPLVTFVTAQASRRIVLHGTFDTVAHTVTLDIPQPMLAGVTSVRIALGETNASASAPAFGGKIWQPGLIYGGTWNPNFNLWGTSARTLVVIHGIFSSVETAYDCANSYLSTTANGSSTAPYSYQQIFGFDYDYAQPPDVEAPLFAAFINKLGLTNYDIEAHSYGTLVTLGALPKLAVRPNRTVLVGGPLPLRGSPIADPSNVLLRDLLLTLAAETISSPAQIDEAIQSGMVASLATNSPALTTLLNGVKGMAPYPNIERVAGTQEYDVEQLFWGPLKDAGVDVTAWDGVVEESAALSTGLTATRQTTIPYAHMGEPCDQPTIDFVTSAL